MPASSNRARLAVLLAALAISAAVAVVHFGRRDPPPSATGADAAGLRNVLLISIDTCRADHLGSYGHRGGATPHLDALAADGVRFAHAFTTAPTTLPAHASLMTSQIPPVHGVRSNEMRLSEELPTLAELFGREGFDTGAIVGARVLRNETGLGRGFALYDDANTGSGAWSAMAERRADEVTARVLSWLAQRATRPFFLFVHYYDPHFSYTAPAPFSERFGDPYLAEIAFVDQQIERVLEHLRAVGLYERTVIVVTADHGEGRGDHGEVVHNYFTYQSTMHIPLIIRSPGVSSGRVIDERVSIADVAPTLLRAFGIDPPAAMVGNDLSPLLSGSDGALPEDRVLYGECLQPSELGCAPLFTVIRGDWKLIQTTHPELYDLATDPAEQTNRFAERIDVATELGAALERLLSTAESGDIDPAALDAQEIAMLEALGYTVGASLTRSHSAEEEREDPKDFLPFYRERSEIVGQLVYLRTQPPDDPVTRRALAALAERAESLVEQRPRVRVFHGLSADIALMRADHQRAADALIDALGTAPDHQPTMRQLNGLLLRPDVSIDVDAAFSRALRVCPEAGILHHGAALAAAQAGRSAEARRHWDAALVHGQGSVADRVDFAVALSRGGDAEGAVEELDRAAAMPMDAQQRARLESVRAGIGR